MNEQSDEEYLNAELITIVEGPSPQFQPPMETWALSVHEARAPSPVAYCRMRTISGRRMLQRCQDAWAEARPVQLDFPDEMGLRRRATILAVRWSETDEGDLLHLWVRLPEQLETGNDHDLELE